METPFVLFVYGSLRRGRAHHVELSGARFLGPAETAPRYALVRYEGDYPALYEEPSAGHGVAGELYEVSAAHLDRLDEFEDCPLLYQRERVTLESGQEALAYVVSAEVAGRYPAWIE